MAQAASVAAACFGRGQALQDGIPRSLRKKKMSVKRGSREGWERKPIRVMAYIWAANGGSRYVGRQG